MAVLEALQQDAAVVDEAVLAVVVRRRLRRVAALEWRSKGALFLTVSLDDYLARRGDVLEDVRERWACDDGEVLAAMTKCLTEREREIAERLMGFNGYLPRSHAEVGRALGISQQHVSRLWRRVIEKLRVELEIER